MRKQVEEKLSVKPKGTNTEELIFGNMSTGLQVRRIAVLYHTSFSKNISGNVTEMTILSHIPLN